MAQLLLVESGEFFENFAASRGEGEMDPAAVFRVLTASHQPLFHQAVHKAHRAVMPDLEAVGKIGHRDGVRAGKPADHEQRLVVLRGHAGGAGGLFAEMKELPQGVAKAGEGFVFGLGDHRFAGSHGMECSQIRPAEVDCKQSA